MSMSDLYPTGPDPAAPLREQLLDCPACTPDATCPAHQADAAIAEDCHAAYLHLRATGAN